MSSPHFHFITTISNKKSRNAELLYLLADSNFLDEADELIQLRNVTGINSVIDYHQFLKYQPSVTSRQMFQYFMIINGIK